jgi:hypothetical protein
VAHNLQILPANGKQAPVTGRKLNTTAIKNNEKQLIIYRIQAGQHNKANLVSKEKFKNG